MIWSLYIKTIYFHQLQHYCIIKVNTLYFNNEYQKKFQNFVSVSLFFLFLQSECSIYKGFNATEWNTHKLHTSMCECAETLCNIDFFTAGDKITSTSADTSTTNTGFSRQLPKKGWWLLWQFSTDINIWIYFEMNSQDVIRLFPRGLVGFHDTGSRRSWEASTFCCSCCSAFIIQTVLKNIIGPNYIFQA